MSFKVEHGIPIPTSRGKGYTAALRSLGVGDSVVLPLGLGAVGPTARQAGLTGKYRAQTVEGGVRIWRTKE